jgi:hypothetical protein
MSLWNHWVKDTGVLPVCICISLANENTKKTDIPNKKSPNNVCIFDTIFPLYHKDNTY